MNKRYKLILDDHAPNDGAVRQQIIFVGAKAMQRGYGVLMPDFELSPEDQVALKRDSLRDDSPYLDAEDPYASRIYTVHPDTWEQIKSTTVGKPVDVFRARRIQIGQDVFFTVHEPL